MLQSVMNIHLPANDASTPEALRSQAEKLIRDNAVRFLASLHDSIGFNKLYAEGQTHELVETRSLSLGGFYKLLERMREGGGLYRDPVLLSAVLADTGISADSLFQSSRKSSEKVSISALTEQGNSTIGQGNDDSEKQSRRGSLKVRLRSALNIVYLVQALRLKDSFDQAYLLLYINYSRLRPGAYPHFRARPFLRPLDILLSMYRENNSFTSMQQERIGRLITLAYIQNEIAIISRAYHRNTEIQKHRKGYTPNRLLHFEFEGVSEASVYDTFNNISVRFKDNIIKMRSLNPTDQIWYVSEKLLDAAIGILVFLVLGGYWREENYASFLSAYKAFPLTLNNFINYTKIVRIDQLFLAKLTNLFQLLMFRSSSCDSFITSPITDVFVVPYSTKEEHREPKDGLSWQTAFSSLPEAVAYLQDKATLEAPFRIKLASGTYRSMTDDFWLPQYVSLSGGWSQKNNKIIQEMEPLSTLVCGRHNRAVLRGPLDYCIIDNITFSLNGEMASGVDEKNDYQTNVQLNYGTLEKKLFPLLIYTESSRIVVKYCLFIARKVAENPLFDNLGLDKVAYYKCKAIQLNFA